MRRFLALTFAALALAPGAGLAQSQPPAGSGSAPGASTGGTGPTPSSTATAPTAGTTSPPGPGATAPNPPGTSATPGAAVAGKTITVRVPSGGSYTAYIQEDPAATPKTVQDKAELSVPPAAKSVTIYVLDPKSGYAARRTVDVKTAEEQSFASPDFRLLQKVRVVVTGKGDKPVAQAMVSLTDGGKNSQRKVVTAASQGVAEFDFVGTGRGSLTVTPEGGTATTKEVTIDVPRGEPVQTIPVSLPEVTATVEPPAGSEAAAEPGSATTSPGTAATAPAQPAVQGTPPGTPLPQAPSSGGSGGMIISWIFFLALLAGGYYYFKKQGITVDQLIKKLGVQPDTVVHGGGSLAGANLASGMPAPGPPPPPPPVVADPNQCQFCGQMKDPSGGCACTVTRGGAAPAANGFGPTATPLGTGPRLVGMQGTYMGHVFPIHGTVVLGRDASNPVPLDRDTTASRRHAQITADGGVYRIQDLGSSNGTYVNGAKVTEQALTPGDEVSVGGTRFRFEL
jgi:hypothetical protein